MKTKLFLVEGLPGSGKSTFAQRIADYYKNDGVKTELYSEGGFHPADLAWNAYIPVKTLDSVLAPFEHFRSEIDKHTRIEDNHAIISYMQVKTEEQAFYSDMEAWEVYDNRVSFDVFKGVHRKRWSIFGQQAQERDVITVFECAFLQNHINELMLYQLAELGEMKRYFNKLIQTVLILSPALVYISLPSVRETIERAAGQREGWLDGMIHYIEQTPYGKRRGLKNGLVQALEARKSMELEIVKSLPIQTIILEDPSFNWEALWRKLEAQMPSYEKE